MKRILAFAASAVALSGCTTAQAPPVIATQTVIASDDRAAPDTMRWLYGSGEAAGASIQTWRQIADYAIATAGGLRGTGVGGGGGATC